MQRSRQRDDLRELQDADGTATHPFAVWEIASPPSCSCDLVASRTVGILPVLAVPLEEEKRQKEVDAANKKGKKGKKGVLGKLRARNDAQQAALDQRAREAAARPAVVHMRGTEGQARKAAHQREL